MASETRAAIEALIPHRAPFLFVDRIVEQTAERIVTEWDVRADLPALAGHYPGDPLVPGVLIAEFAFQSAAILLARQSVGAAEERRTPVLTRIEEARFKQIVRAGETLRAEVTLLERLANARYAQARVMSAGKNVLRLRFTVALIGAASPLP